MLKLKNERFRVGKVYIESTMPHRHWSSKNTNTKNTDTNNCLQTHIKEQKLEYIGSIDNSCRKVNVRAYLEYSTPTLYTSTMH